MSTEEEKDPRLSQPLRAHRASSAADARRVRSLGARIFAELLPQSIASVPHSLRSEPPSDGSGRPDWEATPFGTAAQGPHTPAKQVGKETLPMRAYRTESRYYFSSRQLLPVGSVVFFSEKLRRYVHPTDGTLLDPHPRLQRLSDAESLELEEHWKQALVRY
jgi:hypothetical protein